MVTIGSKETSAGVQAPAYVTDLVYPAAGHGGAELWLPEPAGRRFRPPGQSQAEAAEARGEPALNCGSLLTPGGDSQIKPRQRKCCLVKWKSSSVLLSLE